MPLEDDLFMRMISQLVTSLLKASGLRKQNELQSAEEALADGLKDFGLTLEVVRTVPSSTLRNVVRDPVRRALVGATLCELAMIARHRGDQDKADQLDDTATDLMEDLDVSALPHEVQNVLPPDMRE